jgi:hypothetical protein
VPVAVPGRHEDRVQEASGWHRRTWRFTVLDLRTGVETALPETAASTTSWLAGRRHVLYRVRGSSGRTDVWVSPLTGGAPRMLVPDADSPAAVTLAGLASPGQRDNPG